MANYIYNGMNAKEIANKIIAKEEAYLKTDITSLTFDEKCELLLCNNSAYHPLFRHLDLSSLAEELTPELARRAEAGDAFALYCMSMLQHGLHHTDTRLAYLERAMKAGSLEARVQYASRSLHDGTSKARDILDETLSLLSLGDITERDNDILFRCYSMLAECGQTPIERELYTCLLDELSIKLTLDGDWRAITYLCVKDSSSSEERDFWRTVAHIARTYFYDRGAIQFGDILSISKR